MLFVKYALCQICFLSNMLEHLVKDELCDANPVDWLEWVFCLSLSVVCFVFSFLCCLVVFCLFLLLLFCLFHLMEDDF